MDDDFNLTPGSNDASIRATDENFPILLKVLSNVSACTQCDHKEVISKIVESLSEMHAPTRGLELAHCAVTFGPSTFSSVLTTGGTLLGAAETAGDVGKKIYGKEWK